MRFDEWLDAERGRTSMIAAHFDVSRSAVSQWRVNGVPVIYILALHQLIGDEVPIEELVARPVRDDSPGAVSAAGVQ